MYHESSISLAITAVLIVYILKPLLKILVNSFEKRHKDDDDGKK